MTQLPFFFRKEEYNGELDDPDMVLYKCPPGMRDSRLKGASTHDDSGTCSTGRRKLRTGAGIGHRRPRSSQLAS